MGLLKEGHPGLVDVFPKEAGAPLAGNAGLESDKTYLYAGQLTPLRKPHPVKNWEDFRKFTVEKPMYPDELFKLHARKGAKKPQIMAVHADRSDQLYEVDRCCPGIQYYYRDAVTLPPDPRDQKRLVTKGFVPTIPRAPVGGDPLCYVIRGTPVRRGEESLIGYHLIAMADADTTVKEYLESQPICPGGTSTAAPCPTPPWSTTPRRRTTRRF